MSDRLFFTLAGGAAVLMLVAALVWPQGLGARSPWPVGHVTAAAQYAADLKSGKVKPPEKAGKAKLRGGF